MRLCKGLRSLPKPAASEPAFGIAEMLIRVGCVGFVPRFEMQEPPLKTRNRTRSGRGKQREEPASIPQPHLRLGVLPPVLCVRVTYDLHLADGKAEALRGWGPVGSKGGARMGLAGRLPL